MQGIHGINILQKLNKASAKNMDAFVNTAQAIPDKDYEHLLQYLANMTTFAMSELEMRKRKKPGNLSH
ncbi:hypothetical protein EDM59_05665 [Brevibacillus nitrificans]|uniref:Uncharacterized protein n=1 Tax=Brevibacillus nitrificans TaxID=651560 RepID=A0A3M8DKI5_9BACL|nr:hypothetical protein [Brevibacillus nitrificans]RNB88602.1 hypothetical protein EDM59_05665 [Brevibacillus nitrificans]